MLFDSLDDIDTKLRQVASMGFFLQRWKTPPAHISCKKRYVFGHRRYTGLFPADCKQL